MNRLQANLCLLCVTLCWSMEAVLYKCIPAEVPAFATSCVTSCVGAALLLVAFYRRIWEACRANTFRLFSGCLTLAVISAVYNTLYLIGMKSFDVASGAFTFCMTVVILPVVLLTIHRRISPETWVSVLLVFLGILLALGPSLKGEQLPGLGLMGVGCLLRAVGIVILVGMAKRHDPLALATLLELFAGVFSLFGWLWQDPRLFWGLPGSRSLIASWAIYSYFIVAIAQALNVFAMKRVTAANATIVYSMELVFAIAWGALLPAAVVDRVQVTPTILLGMVLVFTGSVAEIFDFRKRRSQHEGTGMEEIE